MTEETLALCKNRVGSQSCRPGRSPKAVCNGTAAEGLLGQRLRRKACPENLRDLAFELWREEAFQSYRFGEITIEINPMHKDK